MFKFISFFIFFFLFSFHSFAKDVFILTLRCGPEQLSYQEVLKKRPFDRFLFYDLNSLYDDKGHITKFVVLHEGRQYPSFREIEYEEVWSQTGGILSSSMSENENGELILTMKTRYKQNKDVFEEYLRIDYETLTYDYSNKWTYDDGTTKKYEEGKVKGICWEPLG